MFVKGKRWVAVLTCVAVLLSGCLVAAEEPTFAPENIAEAPGPEPTDAPTDAPPEPTDAPPPEASDDATDAPTDAPPEPSDPLAGGPQPGASDAPTDAPPPEPPDDPTDAPTDTPPEPSDAPTDAPPPETAGEGLEAPGLLLMAAGAVNVTSISIRGDPVQCAKQGETIQLVADVVADGEYTVTWSRSSSSSTNILFDQQGKIRFSGTWPWPQAATIIATAGGGTPRV